MRFRFPLVCLALPLVALRAAAQPPAEVSPPIGAIRAALERGDLVAAEATARKALQREPQSSELHMWLGRVYGHRALSAPVFKQLGLATRCRRAFERSVRLDPKNVDARWDLFLYYVQAPGVVGGSRAKALEQASEILKLDPVRGHLALGRLAEHDEDALNAEAEYRKATDTDPKRSLDSGVDPDAPGHADAHWRLGLLYEKLGRKDEANVELKEALRLDPGHSQAKKDLERLEGRGAF